MLPVRVPLPSPPSPPARAPSVYCRSVQRHASGARAVAVAASQDTGQSAKRLLSIGALTLGVLTLATALFSSRAQAETIGEVSTAFQLLGPNHKVEVQVFDDPKVGGVACYLSRAKTGGLKGALGIAEDRAEASVACRQVGDIRFNGSIPPKEEVFSERASLIFKHVRVVRMADPKRNALIYLVYSDRLIDGSPKNSVTAVPVPATTPIPMGK